ncbi:MAG: hypothetical protein HY699_10995 [Deltaproteobacteria bacterium]|nr:hypothetical protein [Deltaproteobacteria bacterium]
MRCSVTDLMALVVSVAVEGATDVPVAERLVTLAGLSVGAVYVANGKGRLDRSLRGYNNAARFGRWFVVRDLDRDAGCAPDFVRQLLPTPASHMILRIAVRAMEAWLLADREQMSRFLAVPIDRIPASADALADPKGALVAAARHSRLRSIREDMVPAPGTSARVGPGYPSRIIEFARERWRPRVAARRSTSLAGCIAALKRHAT